MASEQGKVERDAARGEWLERLTRLIYEAAIDGEQRFEDDLRVLLRRYELEWHIKADWPSPGWDT